MRILLVEDDERIVDFVQRGLKAEGYAIEVARSGPAAITMGVEGDFQVIILDLGLPVLNGLQICEHLRTPQIVDGEWNKPTFLEKLTSKVSREGFLSIGALLLALQIFWLYRMHGRGGFQKADGVLLAFLGAGLLLLFSILEVHPGFMLAYALVFVFLGQVAGFPRGEENGPGKK